MAIFYVHVFAFSLFNISTSEYLFKSDWTTLAAAVAEKIDLFIDFASFHFGIWRSQIIRDFHYWISESFELVSEKKFAVILCFPFATFVRHHFLPLSWSLVIAHLASASSFSPFFFSSRNDGICLIKYACKAVFFVNCDWWMRIIFVWENQSNSITQVMPSTPSPIESNGKRTLGQLWWKFLNQLNVFQFRLPHTLTFSIHYLFICLIETQWQTDRNGGEGNKKWTTVFLFCYSLSEFVTHFLYNC